LDRRQRNRLVLAVGVAGTLLAAALLVRPPAPKPHSPQPAAALNAPKPRSSASANQVATRLPTDTGVSRLLPARGPFDFETELARSLREAAGGSAAAQYRTALLLRSCPSAASALTKPDEFRYKGLDEEFIALIEQRKRRCRDFLDSETGDAHEMSREVKELAFQQGHPIALAERRLLSSAQPLGAEEIDEMLIAALVSAGRDRVLRHQSYFLVLATLDRRAEATGIEADEIVRTAWSLLHCRESWDQECDRDTAIAYLSPEMSPSGFESALQLARELDRTIDAGEYSRLRLH